MPASTWRNLDERLQIYLVGVMAFMIGMPGYLAVNWIVFNFDPLYFEPTIIDTSVPFLPWTVIVYAWAYSFYFIPIFIINHRGYFNRAVVAQLFSIAVGCTIFLLYPVHIERPALPAEPANFFDWGIRLNYWLDKPTNCFPSLHVCNSFLSAFIALRIDRKVGIPAIAGATIISVSILTTKHHYFYDALGGLALAVICYFLFVAGYPLPKGVAGPSRRALLVLVTYAFFVGGMFLVYLSGFMPPL